MTVDDLILIPDAAGTLILQEQHVGPRIFACLQKYLGLAELRVDAAVETTPVGASGRRSFTGSTTAFGGDVAHHVTLRFTNDAQQRADLRIEARPEYSDDPEHGALTWKFAATFGAADDAYLMQQRAVEPADNSASLIFDTAGYEPMPGGNPDALSGYDTEPPADAELAGPGDGPGAFVQLKLLRVPAVPVGGIYAGPADVLEMHGRFVRAADGPHRLHWAATETAPFTVGGVDLNVRFCIISTTGFDDEAVIHRPAVGANIPLGGGNSVYIEASLPLDAGIYTLSGRLENGTLSAPGDVEWFGTGVSLADVVPEALLPGSIELRHFALSFVGIRPIYVQATIAVGGFDILPFAPGEVREAVATVTVLFANTSSPRLNVSGRIDAFDMSFLLRTSSPYFDFEAFLLPREDDAPGPSVSSVLANFADALPWPDDIIPWPAPIISRGYFYKPNGSGNFRWELFAEDLLHANILGTDCVVRDAGVIIERRAKNLDGDPYDQVTLQADIQLGSLDFRAVAYLTESPRFYGSIEPDEPLDLAHILDSIVDVAVPGGLPISDHLNLEIDRGSIEFEPQNNSLRLELDGFAGVGSVGLTRFVYDRRAGENEGEAWRTILMRAGAPGGGRFSVSLHDLAGIFFDAAPVDLPEFSIDVERIYYAHSTKTMTTSSGSTSETSRSLIWITLGGRLDLSNLPLIGKEFSDSDSLALEGISLVYAFDDCDDATIRAINTALPFDAGEIPVPESDEDRDDDQPNKSNPTTTQLHSGLSLVANLRIGGLSRPLRFGIEELSPSPEPEEPLPGSTAPADPLPGGTPSPRNVFWHRLHRKMGIAYFDRVGIQPGADRVWVLLDASIRREPLTLSLDGLGAGSPLDRLDMRFRLRGIGIEYDQPPVKIAGGLVRAVNAETGREQYDGIVILETKQINLRATGSYTTDEDGRPSLFCYAFARKPLPSPPAYFEVTGLAAGFGYNRRFQLPPVEEIAAFPLVREALRDGANSGSSGVVTSDQENLPAALERLRPYIPPAAGESFFAAGIRFTSFRVIDTFALVVAEFGAKPAFDLLGRSNVEMPPAASRGTSGPLAKASMVFRARLVPDEGSFILRAQLTPDSYVLSHKCHLSGGYAFAGWFDGPHSGDFVQTLGGYHPDFAVPAHYPFVPRLAFRWKINSNLTVKGDAYFALTPHALMAGGRLEAVWKEGGLKAWFTAEAALLIAWQPYHYDVRISVEMGVSYRFRLHLVFTTITKTIRVHVGADLHLWGPDFSGRAHVHLWVVSFTVGFGGPAGHKPQAVSWNEFRTSFLPAGADVLTIVPQSGLLRELDGRPIFDRAKLKIDCASAVPFSEWSGFEPENADVPFCRPGVAPADLRPADFLDAGDGEPAAKFASLAELRIYHGPVGAESEVTANFRIYAVNSAQPAALWGERFQPDLNDGSLVPDCVGGFTLVPDPGPPPEATHWIARALLMTEPDVRPAFDRAMYFSDPLDPAARTLSEAERLSLFTDFDRIGHEQLMNELGTSTVSAETFVEYAQSLLEAPRFGIREITDYFGGLP